MNRCNDHVDPFWTSESWFIAYCTTASAYLFTAGFDLLGTHARANPKKGASGCEQPGVLNLASAFLLCLIVTPIFSGSSLLEILPNVCGEI